MPHPGLLDAPVANNDALISMLEKAPAPVLKQALIETIRVKGLTFQQREIFSGMGMRMLDLLRPMTKEEVR